MEDNSQTNQNEQSESPKYEVKAPTQRINYWMITSIVLFTCIITITIYPYIYPSQKTEQKNSTTVNSVTSSIPKSSLDNNNAEESSKKQLITSSLNLSQILSKHCINNQISIDLLPIKIVPGTEFHKKYNIEYLDESIQPTIECYPSGNNFEDSNFAKFIAINNTESLSQMIYLYDNTSSAIGMCNPLEKNSGDRDIMIDSKNYFIKVMEPGPYGISTLGLNILMKYDTEFPNINTNIRYTTSIFFKNDKTINSLIKKYGHKLQDGTTEEIFVLNNDESQKNKFKDELFNYLQTNRVFNQAAQEIENDSNSIVPLKNKNSNLQ